MFLRNINQAPYPEEPWNYPSCCGNFFPSSINDLFPQILRKMIIYQIVCNSIRLYCIKLSLDAKLRHTRMLFFIELFSFVFRGSSKVFSCCFVNPNFCVLVYDSLLSALTLYLQLPFLLLLFYCNKFPVLAKSR